MAFPDYSQTPLPSHDELEKLSLRETNDQTANFCVSFWQHLEVLKKLSDKINARTKKALWVLYNSNEPVPADYIKEILEDKDKIVTQGQPGLGGFGRMLLDELAATWPNLNQYIMPGSGNVKLQTFLDLLRDPDGQIYFLLNARFRAALTACFGEKVINDWAVPEKQP